MSWFKDNEDIDRVSRYSIWDVRHTHDDLYNSDNEKVAEEVVRYDSYGNAYRDVYVDGKKVDSYYED